MRPSVPAATGTSPVTLTEALETLLKGEKQGMLPDELAALIEGMAAAPDGFDPDAWLILLPETISTLFSSSNGKKLSHGLRQLRDSSRERQKPKPENRPGERLEALRATLMASGATAFLVPRNDEHQGEYVPARAERLAWLTGFTGSAGMAVVTGVRAAIFVDGRYTLQAKDEVNNAHFDIHHMADTTALQWLESVLSEGDVLGFDPWLHTPQSVGRLEKLCKRVGASLKALEPNPLDRAWTDQPPPPLAPVLPHEIRFTGEDAESKLRRMAADVKDAQAETAFLAQPDSIAWLFNIRGGDVPFTPLPLGFALTHADGTADLFMDSRKLPAQTRAHLGSHVRVHEPDTLGETIDTLGKKGTALLLDPARAPNWIETRARHAGLRIVAGDDPTVLAKACKTEAEINGTRAAHVRDGVALVRFLHWLATDALAEKTSELKAARRLDSERAKNEHFRGPSFPTISGSGPNGAIVHYRVSERTDRTLEAGTLYLVDSGGQYLDGTTDVTRTVAMGAPSAEMRDRFTRVLKGHIAIATARFPSGTSGGQIDGMARRPLWDAGLDYDHGTGHGVGSYLSVHEGPQRISRGFDAVPLEAGMIVSNEPGYYKTGAYGIRIENLVTVVAAPAPAGAERDLLGFETLTLAPIDRTLIDPALLDAAERNWLDGYHRRVYETLAPFLEKKTRDWLKSVTTPLENPHS